MGKVGGLLLGTAGVALVTKISIVEPNPMFGWAVTACLLASMCYGLAGIYIKKFSVAAKPVAIAGCSQLMAGILLIPVTPFALPIGMFTPLIAVNVLALALLCSAVAYLLYYRLIVDIGPTKALTVTFLMPIFGMVWGSLFLNEVITMTMIAGCALIISGTSLVLRKSESAYRKTHRNWRQKQRSPTLLSTKPGKVPLPAQEEI
jgi:drug/metabolite transporter (DMT)-like permease